MTDNSAERRREKQPRTGAEQPWEPEDLVISEGKDPTPERLEEARRRLADEGPSAIERSAP
ncbi:hypothetical protein GCM10022251_54740 [Phytohabitans flavus]|uniref:DUF3072 domain-containing protein n=1 Tax=Phytohabitans flavus TaxID=1076124 RepID=A0A6F8XQ73_9ACTN|nr:hypothetical protein [Phytohabitans flavus]BCB75891.1 hypothetical protein Pflav_023010 [Phytohabitans flavus]